MTSICTCRTEASIPYRCYVTFTTHPDGCNGAAQSPTRTRAEKHQHRRSIASSRCPSCNIYCAVGRTPRSMMRYSSVRSVWNSIFQFRENNDMKCMKLSATIQTTPNHANVSAKGYKKQLQSSQYPKRQLKTPTQNNKPQTTNIIHQIQAKSRPTAAEVVECLAPITS